MRTLGILRLFSRNVIPSKPMMKTREESFVTEEQMMSFTEQRFSDRAFVRVTAGNGGNGCISYFRSRVVVSGAPNGGDGSQGGSVYFKASDTKSDLRHMKMASIRANHGGSGKINNQNGKRGGDIYVNVPVGTLVWEIINPNPPSESPVANSEDQNQAEKGGKKEMSKESQEENSNEAEKPKETPKPKPRKWKDKLKTKKLLADLESPGMVCLAARGGKGGRGNQGALSRREIEYGEPGEAKEIFLELKILADFGMVGFPNAGKSTLLATLTRTLPKIADYPFTTLSPLIGKLRFIDDKWVTVADLPGIIEGSAQNKGLGHEFLRHIERTKGLLFILDLTLETMEIFKQYKTLVHEINAYSPSIMQKPRIIILNKSDMALDPDQKITRLEELFGEKVFVISAKFARNLPELVKSMRELVYP